MLGMLLALAAPQPSPSPLKTISHIHASPFCTAVRENIGPAVGALLANKPVIGEGKSILLQMAQDEVHRAAPGAVIEIDMVKVDRVIGAIVKNLAVTDAALNDLKHIPATPKTEDERQLAAMRDELRAVADAQRRALNLFSGLYESYSSNVLLAKGNPLQSVLAPESTGVSVSAQGGSDMGAPVVVPPLSSPASGEVRTAPSPSPQVTPTPVPLIDEGLAGGTPFAKLFNFVTTFQLQEEPLESRAARSIVTSSQLCK